jgi:polar amino acid transport system substrate-binding protein
MGFESLIPALQSDKVIVPLPACRLHGKTGISRFQHPYFDAGSLLLSPKTPKALQLDDLQGKKIGCQVGTIGADASMSVKEKDPKTEVRTYDNVGEAFMELEKGGVDAVVNDHAVTAYYIKTTGKDKTKMVGELFSADDHYGIAVKKGNTEMLKVINDGLKKIKANGKYGEIYKKWFE